MSLRRPDVRDALLARQNSYTLALKSGECVDYRAIGAIRQMLVAPEDPAAVITRLAEPGVSAVTLTEAGSGSTRSSVGLEVRERMFLAAPVGSITSEPPLLPPSPETLPWVFGCGAQ